MAWTQVAENQGIGDSPEAAWPGGPGSIAFEGVNWGGSTASIMFSRTSGGTFSDVNCCSNNRSISATDNKVADFHLPEGFIRLSVSGGTAPSVNAFISPLMNTWED